MVLEESIVRSAPVPPEVRALLADFDDMFQEPKALPPRHTNDHCIPLIPGAQPVNACPYRYTPHHKDEIQRQIWEMLRNGTIGPNSSPFASPVLFVRQKDGT